MLFKSDVNDLLVGVLCCSQITAPDGSTWEAQFKKPSTCVTTDQLKGKKDALNESMMARLKNALHKEHYTSIVAQDTEVCVSVYMCVCVQLLTCMFAACTCLCQKHVGGANI